ncbi:HAD family hydrolase [Calothrix sp. 336/3]|uniref:HAD family hydrolase n=1 Tax=Calothrix sp. 336/3 TaxID=1337936 RepID=UPI0004E41ED3|nr:HAD hydrolase-like protein [Calothrix sp. 336/3]AKG23343.1 haloacid dehalogenase [Calothrix sp. 336/3]
MAVSNLRLLALDFDGVICDGLMEYFQVAWRTYCHIWNIDNYTVNDDLAEGFYCLRPVIETGWEMPILIKALVMGLPEEKILNDWENIVKQILQADNLDAKQVGIKLDALRDDWIANDLPDWLKLHRFYPGVINKIQATLASDIKFYIITTKEGRFVKQLMQQGGLDLPTELIFGKEYKRPKYEIIRELIKKHNLAAENVWFVEDRLKTLQLVEQQTDLENMQLFLADWGYNTPSERVKAEKDPRVNLLSLKMFAEDWDNWLINSHSV